MLKVYYSVRRSVLRTNESAKSPTELLAGQKKGYTFEKSCICLYFSALYKINLEKNNLNIAVLRIKQIMLTIISFHVWGC